MSQFDFTQMIKKYPLLSSKDVSFLNDFFNRKDILTELHTIQWNRDIKFTLMNKLTYWWLFFLIMSSFVNGFFWFYFRLDIFFPRTENFDPFYILLALIVGTTVFGMYIFFWKEIKQFFEVVRKLKNQNVELSIMPKFVQSIDKKLFYSYRDTYFKPDLLFLKKADLLKKYDKFGGIEDTIKYQINDNINILAWELSTSVKKSDDDWNTYYETNNHCYITKIEFTNPKYSIEYPIHIKKDKNESRNKILQMISFWSKKNRVKLENGDFEKEFDVFSDDEIETRRLLNSSFMYRLYDYVNKIDRKRIYNFPFL